MFETSNGTQRSRGFFRLAEMEKYVYGPDIVQIITDLLLVPLAPQHPEPFVGLQAVP